MISHAISPTIIGRGALILKSVILSKGLLKLPIYGVKNEKAVEGAKGSKKLVLKWFITYPGTLFKQTYHLILEYQLLLRDEGGT